MYGNFYGNNLQQIALSISATSSSAFHQTQGLTISPTSLVGVAPAQDLHYSWTGATPTKLVGDIVKPCV
jgi:hypothetical protein